MAHLAEELFSFTAHAESRKLSYLTCRQTFIDSDQDGMIIYFAHKKILEMSSGMHCSKI
jgi:hypothetical protein